MSEEPNYKDSQKIVGQLYPVLKSKDGQVIDGFHRLAVDPNWKTLTLEEVDTEEKLLVARAVSNWHRRQVSREEKATWINGLAALYKKQGYKVNARNNARGQSINEIKERIMEVAGLPERTVTSYLSEEYKQEPKGGVSTDISASERVENALGKDVAEQFKKEIKEEEKLSPEERAKREEQAKLKRLEKEKKKAEQKAKKEQKHREIEEKIRKEVVKRDLKEVKQELLKDPNFQREVLRETNQGQIITSIDPCPSGICEAPSTIDAGKPIDIKAEQLTRFFSEHPFCICKQCKEYATCAVIR
jgi:hypothetical protein